MKTSGLLRGKCKCMVIKLNHYCSIIIKCKVCLQKTIAHSTYIGALNTYWSETSKNVYRNLLQFNLVLFQLLQYVCLTWRKCTLFIHHVSGSTIVCSTWILEDPPPPHILEPLRLLSCFCLFIQVIQCISSVQ
jgi:hypothetical protein